MTAHDKRRNTQQTTDEEALLKGTIGGIILVLVAINLYLLATVLIPAAALLLAIPLNQLHLYVWAGILASLLARIIKD